MTSRKQNLTTDLTDGLAQIGLLDTTASLEDFLARAGKGRWSARQILEQLVKNELADKARRSLERRLSRSRIGRFKPMADFDWNWPKKIERDLIERALGLEFLQESRNLVLMGTNGLGKTMIARNIAYQAVQTGYSVLFITAAELIDDLRAEVSPLTFRRKVNKYASTQLLCID